MTIEGFSMSYILCFFYKDRLLNESNIQWETIPFDKMTHVIWSFHQPQFDGTIVSAHPHLETDILPQFIKLARHHSTQVLIAIGGWGNSSAFSTLASDKDKRRIFSQSCLELLQETGAQGIDIDWEFPGISEMGGQPEDGFHLILLLRELRETLGSSYTLTIDVPGIPQWFGSFNMLEIEKWVDFSSIMSYDMASPELASTSSVWHNSALYDDNKKDHWSWNRLIEHFAELNWSKLNLGIAFYGRKYPGAEEIGQHWDGPMSHHPTSSALLYSDIHSLLFDVSQSWQKDWDDQAKVPFLKSNEGIIVYDDERSIRQKANFIINEGLAGVIIWELGCDQINGQHPLLNAVAHILKRS